MKNSILKRIAKITLITASVAAVIGTFVFLWNKSKPQVTTYEVVSPTLDSINIKTLATGKIEPRDEVLIKPQLSGIISEVRMEAGQMVKKGDVIAVIKVIPEMGQLNSAESRVKVANINLEQVKAAYNRDSELYKKGVIAKEDYETSTANYKKAVEEASNAKDALDIVRDGISANLASTSTTQVRSTIDGMILDIPVKAGNSVIQSNTFNDGTTIATVADMSNLIFKGTIDETEVGKIKEGMNIKVLVGAMQGKSFDAILEYVSPKGTEENGAVLFEIKAAMQMPKNEFIRAGYSANAEIILDHADNILTLPESCLEFSNDSAFVYILKSETPEQSFERKNISIGISDGIKVEVKKGITTKDRIRDAVKDDTTNENK